ncbi:hypothetical protein Q5752_002526 [Cryptotrichosporon argae]
MALPSFHLGSFHLPSILPFASTSTMVHPAATHPPAGTPTTAAAPSAAHTPLPRLRPRPRLARAAALFLFPAGLLVAQHARHTAAAATAPAAGPARVGEGVGVGVDRALPYTGGIELAPEHKLTYDGLSHFVD